MARFQQVLVLEPITRDWFDRTVGIAHDTVAEYLGGPDLPLIDGAALTPGARYESPDRAVLVTLGSWHRDAESAGRLDTADELGVMSWTWWLDSASAPGTVELAGRLQSDEKHVEWALEMTGGVRIDLDSWWRRGDAAIDGWLENAFGRATFAATPGAGRDGRWRIKVTGKLRGRGLLRPVTSAVLLVNKARLRRSVVRSLATFVEQWNREVPVMVAVQPDELRELITTALKKA